MYDLEWTYIVTGKLAGDDAKLDGWQFLVPVFQICRDCHLESLEGHPMNSLAETVGLRMIRSGEYLAYVVVREPSPELSIL